MNLAVGFTCPSCGQTEADLLEIERGNRADPIAFRLHCTKCERVFREMMNADQQLPVARSFK